MTDVRSRQAGVTVHFDAYARGNRWGGLYDPANPLSHSFLARRTKTLELAGDLTGRRLLDLGCGSGAAIEPLAGQDVEYHGLDIAPTMVAEAQQLIDRLGLRSRFHVVVGSVDELPYPDGYFDAVIAMGLLEYFDDPRAVIRAALQATKRGGRLVFTIPRRQSLDSLAVQVTAPIRRVVRTLSRATVPVERDLYTDAGFRALLESAGCRVVDDRVYNKLPLPYPFTRLSPALAHRAARWAEPRSGLRFLATGYIVACERPR